MRSVASIAAILLACTSLTSARNFTLQKEIRGNDFFSEFSWWSYADPTKGFVE